MGGESRADVRLVRGAVGFFGLVFGHGGCQVIANRVVADRHRKRVAHHIRTTRLHHGHVSLRAVEPG